MADGCLLPARLTGLTISSEVRASPTLLSNLGTALETTCPFKLVLQLPKNMR